MPNARRGIGLRASAPQLRSRTVIPLASQKRPSSARSLTETSFLSSQVRVLSLGSSPRFIINSCSAGSFATVLSGRASPRCVRPRGRDANTVDEGQNRSSSSLKPGHDDPTNSSDSTRSDTRNDRIFDPYRCNTSCSNRSESVVLLLSCGISIESAWSSDDSPRSHLSSQAEGSREICQWSSESTMPSGSRPGTIRNAEPSRRSLVT